MKGVTRIDSVLKSTGASVAIAIMCQAKLDKKGYNDISKLEKEPVDNLLDVMLSNISSSSNVNALTVLESLEGDAKKEYFFDTVMHDVVNALLLSYTDEVARLSLSKIKETNPNNPLIALAGDILSLDRAIFTMKWDK